MIDLILSVIIERLKLILARAGFAINITCLGFYRNVCNKRSDTTFKRHICTGSTTLQHLASQKRV